MMEDSVLGHNSSQWCTAVPSPEKAATMALALLLIMILSTVVVVLLSFDIESLTLALRLRLRGRPPLPPGHFGLPIVGEMLAYVSNPVAFRARKHAEYGPIFKTKLLEKVVFLQPPAGNKFVFANDEKLVHIGWSKSTATLMGRCALTTQTGTAHKLARRHLTPFLEPKALAQYVPRIERHLLKHLAECWQAPPGKDSDEFELSILELTKSVTHSIISDLLISSKPYETEELRALDLIYIRGLLTLPINLPGSAFRRAIKARAAILELLGKMIATRRVELREGKASPTQDLMSYLLTEPDESGRFFSDEEIKDNILVFLFGGHDTTTTVTTMALRWIALVPGIRQPLMEEHDIIARRKSPGEGLAKEDLAEMKYTWCVIQETMRMQNAVDGGTRKALQDLEIDGCTIPKGWKVIWNNLSHRDPNIFSNPEKFDPTRFAGSQKVVPYAFVPFGGGPHMCIGRDFAKMEMLIFIYYVMRNYEFTLVDPEEPFIYLPFPIQKSGTLMRVRKLVNPT